MGNTRPVGMASARATKTAWWCSHCGVSLAAVPGSGGSVRCAFCHRATRVEHHQRGVVGERDMTEEAPPSPPRSLAAPMPPSYPRVCGKKRAVLVGVSYTGTAYELKGTANDVREMRRLLCDKFGFTSGCILELTGTLNPSSSLS
jgi:metacaspase-1